MSGSVEFSIHGSRSHTRAATSLNALPAKGRVSGLHSRYAFPHFRTLVLGKLIICSEWRMFMSNMTRCCPSLAIENGFKLRKRIISDQDAFARSRMRKMRRITCAPQPDRLHNLVGHRERVFIEANDLMYAAG